MSEQKVTWLTQEAHDRLVAELTERTEVTRGKISKTIELAREEGDLRENGGYHAAKEDQGRNEARIRELKYLLEHAQVGRPDDVVVGAVSHGSTVTIEFPGGDRETMLVASREEKAHTDLEICSPDSPLGKALLGQHSGTKVAYELPNGRNMEVTLVEVHD
ncbi:MAG: transcription elongation factor GreA [Candidatus Nanopelagicales bacterium]|nr:transcription elongation factor GreA [Candidatus Nanopelagicales bacterium]MCU0295318.1 transcription elongation factor GreA [Candidatus Nanopelagicales bacterium]MCU0298508.1 transcription elongation factor GreA [Candidatus Nanopelagicales bacterium]